MTMYRDVFISYSHEDRDFVIALCADLEDCGVSYFRDEKELEWGFSIGKSVREALSGVAGVLLVLSPASLKSGWVPFEIGYASARGRQVLPLLSHPGLQLPEYLGDIKYLVSKDAALEHFRSAAWKERSVATRVLKSCRSNTIVEAAAEVGLVDVEDRKKDLNTLPPAEFYALARNEIAISGVSAFRTFDKHFDILQRALDDGKRLYLLILAPEAPVIPHLNRAHPHIDVTTQIGEVIGCIIRTKLMNHSNFKVRFLQEVPPFTANMIDGDLVPSSAIPDDAHGQIRVQPTTKHQTRHSGMVFQFARIPGGGGFDRFAADFRDQWSNDGVVRADLGL